MAGVLLGNARRISEAREHYAKSIALSEKQGKRFWAAKSREFFAIDLARTGAYSEAIPWAQSALDVYQNCFPLPVQQIEKVSAMIKHFREREGHQKNE